MQTTINDSLSKETLLSMYETMVLLRQADTKTCNLQKTGQIGTCSTFAGHEAIDVGAAYALKTSDVFVPYYRDQGILISRGLQISDILAYWSGNEFASSKSPNLDLPICVPIGTQYTQAAGIAASIKYRKQNNMVLVTGGDGGAAGKGDFAEALNVSSLWHLPIVFLIKNNQWAISTPSCRGTAGEIYKRAVGVGMRGLRVDGNNIQEVYGACKEAFERARQNKGPTLIEAMCYRLRPHTTVDNDESYRSVEEMQQAWKDSDPVLNLKQYLMNKNWWTEQDELNLLDSVKLTIEQQVGEYLNYQTQDLDNIFDYTYANSEHLSKQKEECARYFTNSKEH